MENFLKQQDEGVNVRVIASCTESGKDSKEKTDEDESSGKIQKPNNGNELLEEEPSPAEDQDEVMCSESPGLVKGIIGVLYKG